MATRADFEILDEVVTPGQWGQFSPTVGPWQDQASEYFRNRDTHDIRNLDTSRHMTAHGPKRLSEWKHADDTAFAEALVNAYRSGQLGFREDF